MKRILTISDLHLDRLDAKELLDAFQDIVREECVDVILIGGDISNSIEKTQLFMKKLATITEAYYILGNHDIWNKQSEQSTASMIQQYMDDPLCLQNEVLHVTEQTCVICHSGWYDYTFADTEKYSLAELATKRLGNLVWQDKIYINFDKTDIELANQFNADISAMIAENQDKTKILLTHMINHENFTVKHNIGRDWTFFNGFLGSRTLTALAKKCDKAICGHVHYRATFTEDGTDFVCACLGYQAEWQYALPNEPLKNQIYHASYIFDVT